MGGQRRKNKTSKATNVCPPSLRKERGQRRESERQREREIKKERERSGEGGRELGGNWPSYTAQYDTHFSSLHTYSRDQGTGIF